MERLWRLYSHRFPFRDRHQQDPSVFYVHFAAYAGFSYHYLYGIGLLEKYEEIYLGGEEKSVVLFVVNGE